MKKKNKKPTSLVSLLVVTILVIITLIFVAKSIFLERDTFSLQDNEASFSTEVKEGINSRRLELMQETHQFIVEERERQRELLMSELASIEERLQILREEIVADSQEINELLEETEESWLHFDMGAVEESTQSLRDILGKNEELNNRLTDLREEFSQLASEDLIADSEEVEDLERLFADVEMQLQELSEVSPNFERWENRPNVQTLMDSLSESQRADVVLLANCIYFEGGSTSEEEMLRIGSVVMNRTQSEYYPDTIEGVLYDNRWGAQQYSSTDRFFSQELTEEAYEIAYRIVVLGERTSSFNDEVVAQIGVGLNPGSAYFELVFTSEWHSYWKHK